MVKKAEGTDRAFFWGTDFSTQGYMKWTLEQYLPIERLRQGRICVNAEAIEDGKT